MRRGGRAGREATTTGRETRHEDARSRREAAPAPATAPLPSALNVAAEEAWRGYCRGLRDKSAPDLLSRDAGGRVVGLDATRARAAQGVGAASSVAGRLRRLEAEMEASGLDAASRAGLRAAARQRASAPEAEAHALDDLLTAAARAPAEPSAPERVEAPSPEPTRAEKQRRAWVYAPLLPALIGLGLLGHAPLIGVTLLASSALGGWLLWRRDEDA